MNVAFRHLSEPSKSTPTAAYYLLGIWSLLMIKYSVSSGIQNDYIAYLGQWKLVLAGADPWSGDNAYGPLHNLLGYFLVFGKLAPKLFIVLALTAANALLFYELARANKISSDYVIYLLAIPTNILIVSATFAYGLNDSLVAALIVCALIARLRGHDVLAGSILGLAVLLKYYPIFLVPLFALDNGRIRWGLVSSAAVVTLIGLAAAALVWGDAFLAAVALGVERQPKLLSILNSLKAYPFLIGGPNVLAFLIRTNVVFVLAVAALSVFMGWRLRLHWLEASVLGYLLVLLTYKLGHPQFYIPWLFLVAALPLADTSSARRLAWLCLPFVMFLSAFEWGYAYGSEGYSGIRLIREGVGFFAFSLGVTTLVAVFWGSLEARYRTSVTQMPDARGEPTRVIARMPESTTLCRTPNFDVAETSTAVQSHEHRHV